MKIRIINENGWEKSFDFDKSIIRVGSQVSCDIYLRDNNVAPLLMQIVRSGGKEVGYEMRFFAENVYISRGNENIPAEMTIPYDVMDEDKINFGFYRMIISLENDKKRVRQSSHIQAEMFLSRRELSLETPINGYVVLKNLGTKHPCQFRMTINGLPEECLKSSPLPYLYPGASSSVGFIIYHLQNKPVPGFHTVSLVLSAPDEYFGEVLEFKQDIYVNPVFKNEIILEDDSDQLTDYNDELRVNQTKQTEKTDVFASVPSVIPDSVMMNNEDNVPAKQKDDETIRVIGGEKGERQSTFEEDPEDEVVPFQRKKKQKVVVIRHGNEDVAFEDETEPDEDQKPQEQQPEEITAEEKIREDSQTTAPEETEERLPERSGEVSAAEEQTAAEREEQIPAEETEEGSPSAEQDEADEEEGAVPSEPEETTLLTQPEAVFPEAEDQSHLPDAKLAPVETPEPGPADNAAEAPIQLEDTAAVPQIQETVPSPEEKAENTEVVQTTKKKRAKKEDGTDTQKAEDVRTTAAKKRTRKQDPVTEEAAAEPAPQPVMLLSDAGEQLVLSNPEVPSTGIAEGSSAAASEQPSQTHFVNRTGDSAGGQIPVVAHSSGFDDFDEADTSEKKPVEAPPNKPQIRVMKGGGFDD